MRHLKEFLVFESNNINLNDLVNDLNDMFLEMIDKGHKVMFRGTGNDIRLKFKSGSDITISEFFNSYEFKRAYAHIMDSGFIKHYLNIYKNYDMIVNQPSASYYEDTPWEEFSSDNREMDSLDIEFHIPDNTWHIIWIPTEDPENWDVYMFGFKSREEALRLKDEAPISKKPSGEIVKSYYTVVSDDSLWNRKR